MEELGYKQDSLQAWHTPRVAWNILLAVTAGHCAGCDLRPYRRAARLHSCSDHHADLRRTLAGVAV